MDEDPAKIVADRAREGHYRAAMLMLFKCVITEVTDSVSVERRERILQNWRKLHLEQINETVAHVEEHIGLFKIVERNIFGTSDIDGETVRIIERKLLDEVETEIRELLGLEVKP